MAKPLIKQKIDYIFTLEQIIRLQQEAESTGKNAILVALAVTEKAKTILAAKPVNYRPDAQGILTIDDSALGDDYEDGCPIPPGCDGDN